jgi:hypothetical protein
LVKRIALLLLVVISLLGLPAAALAAAAGDGVIEGILVNGTANAKGSLDAVEVTLKTRLNGGDIGESKVKTDAKGSFVFDNLPTGSEYSYVITATYQQADYSSTSITFEAGVLKKTIEILVYDATNSDESIRVMTAHTIIYPGEGGIQIKEYSLFVNTADKAYVGSGINDDKRTLRLFVPEGATGLQYSLDLMECCVANSEEGIADTMAVPPGKREMSYLYNIGSRSGTFDYSNKVLYPTESYTLLISEGIEASSEGLVQGDPIELQGQRFNNYSLQKLNQGDLVRVRLSNLPRASQQGNAVKWVAYAVVALAGTFTGIFLLKRRRPAAVPVVTKSNLDQRKQELLIQLAELDDSFEGGAFTEEVYRKQRTLKKTQLIKLMQRSAKGHRDGAPGD